MYKNNSISEKFIDIKHRGKIYTPDYLVKIILQQGHYVLGNISKKHVIDNSCGDGQFMIHIVDAYCRDFLLKSNDTRTLKVELETYIHAIDIDADELAVCKERCSRVAGLYNVSDVKWNFICSDTLSTHCYDRTMDFVIGNPPYVRVHNLDENFDTVKNYFFGNGGMTDLFIAFYEVGLKMLNENGILCYITPSSFFTSLAGFNMRKHLVYYQLLESVCNLKHFQPFDAITYTTIICLNKSCPQSCVKYYEFDENKLIPVFVDTLSIEEYYLKKEFYFSSKENLKMLRDIFENCIASDVQIKNGYATLADECFIKDFDFESKYIIPVVKASKAMWTKIFYPYDKNACLVSEDELKSDKKAYSYILSQKEKLLKRDNDKVADRCWYAFGRSQALKDTYSDKISINALIRRPSDLKIVDVPSGIGVYSGLYIISKSIPTEKIKTTLMSDDFGLYITLLGKYKSGGYYAFSSKDVKYFLDYKLRNEAKNYVEQLSIFNCN